MPPHYERKTDRIYGLQLSRVRRLICQAARITAPDLLKAGLASSCVHARALLAYLVKRGELRLVRRGRSARHKSRPAIFTGSTASPKPPQNHEHN